MCKKTTISIILLAPMIVFLSPCTGTQHLAPGSQPAQTDDMPEKKGLINPFFGFVFAEKNYPEKKQVKLLKELGYSGIGIGYSDDKTISDFQVYQMSESDSPILNGSGFNRLQEVIKEADRNNSKLSAVFFLIGIDPDKQKYDPKLKEAIKLLKGRDTIIWLLVCQNQKYKISSPDGDRRAVEIIREIADLAHESGLKVALYPHVSYWMERVEDAVRIAKKVNRRNVGVTFGLFHWLLLNDEETMEPILKSARPYLFVVNIHGSSKEGSIETLGRGSFDTYKLLKALQKIDYIGPIGFLTWGIRGDIRANLQQSMMAWRELSNRIAAEADATCSSVTVTQYLPLKNHPATTDEGWCNLFAEDLSDAVCKFGTWKVENGMLTQKGGDGKVDNLWTKDKYGDFILDLEVKMNERGNSGVFVRAENTDVTWMTGIEVQIMDTYGENATAYITENGETVPMNPTWLCGGIDGRVKPRKNVVKKPGQWNHYTITCIANKIYVVLNGMQVVDMDIDLWTEPFRNPDGTENPFETPCKDMPRVGHIGLQDHNTPLWFRNIRIKLLDK